MGYTIPNVESQVIYIISFYIYYSICLICNRLESSWFCIMEWIANILLIHEQE